jgi:hypothetical protein
MWLCLAAPLTAQTGPAPQTPRQALIEIMFGKDRSATLKHLPSALVSQLAADPAAAEDFLDWLKSTASPGRPIQVFEAGPILAVLEGRGDKPEMAVEKEDLQGSNAELVIVLRQGGERVDATLLEPRLKANLKMEDGVWRLIAMEYGARVRLDNAATLEGYFRQKAAARPRAQESSAVGAVRTLNTAEVTYAVSYPNVGFTCSLTDLDGSESSKQPSERAAMLIDENLASGRKSGYIFQLSGCGEAVPAVAYKVTAVPEQSGPGLRAFCSDESGVIRFSDDGKAETCLASGQPLL